MPTLAPSHALMELGRLCRAGVVGETATSTLAADDLRMLARRHRVEGFVAAAIGDRATAAAVAARSLAQAAEVARLVGVLDGLDPLVLKGLAVAAQGGPVPHLKQSADIDLLVPETARREAELRLKSHGYTLAVPRRPQALNRWAKVSNQSVWLSPAHTVELHHRPLAIPFAQDDPATEVAIAPGITVRTFGPHDQYRYLAAHGALSGWFRLKWLVDFAAFAGARPEGLPALHDSAIRHHDALASAQALLLANRLLGVPLPDALAERVRAEPGAMTLAARSIALLAAGEPTERFLGTLPLHAAWYRLNPGLGRAIGRLRDLVAQRRLA